jgi:hypothetical protein
MYHLFRCLFTKAEHDLKVPQSCLLTKAEHDLCLEEKLEGFAIGPTDHVWLEESPNCIFDIVILEQLISSIFVGFCPVL